MEIAPFRRRQVRPADATRDEIFTVVSHHLEERVIGLDDPIFAIEDEDADDVGVDQTPDLRFPLFEIAVQPGILQRDGRLRGEQREHRDPAGREDPSSEVVLEVEHADEIRPGDQGQGKNGARPAPLALVPDVV